MGRAEQHPRRAAIHQGRTPESASEIPTQFCRGARARWSSPRAISYSQPEPSHQESGNQNNEGFLDELARHRAVRTPKRRPGKAEPLLGEGHEEPDAQRVGRERIETAMREQREEQHDPGPSLPAEEDSCDDNGSDEREHERMRDGAMGKG